MRVTAREQKRVEIWKGVWIWVSVSGVHEGSMHDEVPVLLPVVIDAVVCVVSALLDGAVSNVSNETNNNR